MRIRPDVGDDDFPIAADAAARGRLDYLALGHWHSTLGDGGGRCWYCGTHETSKFGERESGNVLVVTLKAQGAVPEVERVRTGVLTWLDQQVDLDHQPLADAMRRFREWTEPERHLLRIGLQGAAGAETVAQVEELRTLLSNRFLYTGCDESNLRPASVSDLGDGLGAPHIALTAQRLAVIAQGNGGSGGEKTAATAQRALQLLQKAVWQCRNG
jgi:hypothetical protein